MTDAPSGLRSARRGRRSRGLIGTAHRALAPREFLPTDPGYRVDSRVEPTSGDAVRRAAAARRARGLDRGRRRIADRGSSRSRSSSRSAVADALARPVEVIGIGVSGARTPTCGRPAAAPVTAPSMPLVVVVGCERRHPRHAVGRVRDGRPRSLRRGSPIAAPRSCSAGRPASAATRSSRSRCRRCSTATRASCAASRARPWTPCPAPGSSTSPRCQPALRGRARGHEQPTASTRRRSATASGRTPSLRPSRRRHRRRLIGPRGTHRRRAKGGRGRHNAADMATPKPGEIRCPTCHRSTVPAAFCTQCGSAIPSDARIRPRGMDREELQDRIRARRSGGEPYRRGGTADEPPGYERFEPEPEDAQARKAQRQDARRRDDLRDATDEVETASPAVPPPPTPAAAQPQAHLRRPPRIVRTSRGTTTTG